MAKALGWAHCTVPDILSGTLQNSGSTPVTVLHHPVWCSIMIHTRWCFIFLHLELPTSFSHILITYVLVFLGIMAPFYG